MTQSIIEKRAYHTNMSVELIRLDRKLDRAWALLPQVAARILDFGVRMGQADIDLLVKKVEAAFVVPMDTVAVWLAVDGERVLGHLLAVEDDWAGQKIGFVLQLSMDGGRVPEDVRRLANQELEAWARGHGYRKLLMLTRRGAFRAWRRLYGFDLFRYLMTKELGDE